MIYKKTNIVLCVLVFAFLTVTAFSQKMQSDKEAPTTPEIVFSNKTWKEVTALGKKTGKYIFVDAFTSWCGPCKLLKTTTFKDKKAADYFNTNFINYTVDMEEGEGLVLAEKWNIVAYPALLFFTPEGKMVLKQIGYVDGAQLVEFGKQALQK